MSAATALLAAAGITGLPHVGNYVSSAAVINAPLLAVRAPIDGMIVATSGRVGSAVAPGTPLFHVDASAESRSEFEALKAALATVEAEIDAIDAQIVALEELRDELANRATHMTARGRERIAAQRAQAAARLAGAEAELEQIAAQIARTEKLMASGAVTEAQLEDHRFERAAQSAVIGAVQSEIEELDVEAAALSEGVPFRDRGISEEVWQRQQEIYIRIVELKARHSARSGEAEALRPRIAEAERHLTRRETFAPKAPSNGAVWRAAPAEGAAVAQGDTVMEILDCEQRFVEVAVGERHFEDIAPGDPAYVQMKGTNRSFLAQVEAVRGAAGRFEREALAVRRLEADTDQLSVLVRLDAVAQIDGAIAASFCDVGRTAEVRFPKRGGMVPKLVEQAHRVGTDLASVAAGFSARLF